MTGTATTVYTDGACTGNPGPGGWAWAVPGGAWASGAAAHTTNQRMEVQAVLEAVTCIDGPIHVISDSTYVVNCFRDGWWEGWLRKGWVNSQKKPVANQDLWVPLIAEYRREAGRLQFSWVKGHSGDRMNDTVDRLAVAAAASQTDGRGDTPPVVLGSPDAIRSKAATTGRIPGTDRTDPDKTRPGGARPGEIQPPSGHRLVVTGVKPPGLGGYDDQPAARAVGARLSEVLAAKALLHRDLVVLSGLSLGSEQLGAQAAIDAGVRFVAVLAYPDQDRVWSSEARRRYRDLIAAAADVLTLDQQPPDTRQRAGASLGRRDAWLARHAEEAIVVWDGADPAVGRSIRSLQDHLGEDDVWLLDAPA